MIELKKINFAFDGIRTHDFSFMIANERACITSAYLGVKSTIFVIFECGLHSGDRSDPVYDPVGSPLRRQHSKMTKIMDLWPKYALAIDLIYLHFLQGYAKFRKKRF